jgi:hypothetical protein
MTMDAEIERHRRTWIGFTRFMKWGSGAVVLLLVILALTIV